MKKSTWTALLLCSTLCGEASIAADGEAATANPAAEITGVYTWMADANTVALVMDVNPAATTASKFSAAVQYVFHTHSAAKFGAAASSNFDVVCEFDGTQKISCWAGAIEYVSGDASSTAGIKSSSGRVKVFAGLRDDPSFFNLDGFNAVLDDLTANASLLTAAGDFHAADQGCPTLGDTATALATQLAHAPYDLSNPPQPLPPPVDHFAGLNVLAIVVTIDKSLLTAGGPIIGVAGATYSK